MHEQLRYVCDPVWLEDNCKIVMEQNCFDFSFWNILMDKNIFFEINLLFIFYDGEVPLECMLNNTFNKAATLNMQNIIHKDS